MIGVRRTLTAIVLAFAFVAAATPALGADAASITEEIFADYSLDHVLNETYTAPELQAALDVAKTQGEPFKEFERAVQEVYDRDVLGLSTGDGGSASPGPVDQSGLLPEPRGPGERDQPPWPLLVMAALGAVLVVSGAGSSIYRRVHR